MKKIVSTSDAREAANAHSQLTTAAMGEAGLALRFGATAISPGGETMHIHTDVKMLTEDAHHHPTSKAA